MTPAEFKAALSAKIKSKEEFDALLLAASPSNRSYIGVPQIKTAGGMVTCEEKLYSASSLYPRPAETSEVFMNFGWPVASVNSFEDRVSYFRHSRWWLAREWLRILHGVYSVDGAVLGRLATHPSMFGIALHSSSDAPGMVAYTQDPESGERDAQTKSTLGRVARRFFPWVPDDRFRDWEAAYRADLDPTIEFIDGPGITDAYLAGPESCMSKTRDFYASSYRHQGFHPVDVYNAPGFKLAVRRGGTNDRTYSARALCWINPADAEDKRYVRVYGDTVLTRRLEKAGFKCRTLEGALLQKIQIGSGDLFVMPYLDGAGGNTPSGRDAGRYVVLEGDFIRVITESMSIKLRGKSTLYAAAGLSTGGYVQLREAPADLFTWTCALTLLRYEETAQEPSEALIDGVVVKVHSESAAAAGMTMVYTLGHAATENAKQNRMFVPAGTPTFELSGLAYIENDGVRSTMGFMRLDRRYYPESGWTSTRLLPPYRAIQDEHGERTFILRRDQCMQITSDDGITTKAWKHISECSNKKAWTPLHKNTRDVPLFADASVKIVKTPSGRKVVVGVHEVRETHDGIVDFERNVKSFTWMHMKIFYSEGNRPDVPQPRAAILSEILIHIRSWARGSSWGTSKSLDDSRHRVMNNLRPRYVSVPVLVPALNGETAVSMLSPYCTGSMYTTAPMWEMIVALSRRIVAKEVAASIGTQHLAQWWLHFDSECEKVEAERVAALPKPAVVVPVSVQTTFPAQTMRFVIAA